MQKGDFKLEAQKEEPTDDDGCLVNEEPRRYEVRDAETGEKLSGVSFILTPSGEEMHLLTKKGMWVGPMKDIGIYYHGKLHDGMNGPNSLPAIRPIALVEVAHQIIRELAAQGPERWHYGHMRRLKGIGEHATRKWAEYCEENAELVTQREREEEESRERFRKSMTAKGLMKEDQGDNGSDENPTA